MRAEVQELMTADELLALDIPGKTTELVRGRLIVREPPGFYHGRISAKLALAVGTFVYANALGEIAGQDTGFTIHRDPDTVRAPDVAFVSRARMPELQRQRGFGAVTPDLVAEVVSPDDRRGELLEKVGQWLDAGARLVWVIDPERRRAQVYRPDGSVTLLDDDAALDGEDVLPGFSCPLRQLLD